MVKSFKDIYKLSEGELKTHIIRDRPKDEIEEMLYKVASELWDYGDIAHDEVFRELERELRSIHYSCEIDDEFIWDIVERAREDSLEKDKLNEDESWWEKQKRRIKAEPTITGKIGKAISNILFGGDNWDDLEETMIGYMKEPGLSKAEKMDRINQISSVFRKFDGRDDIYTKDEIEAARLED